MCPPTASRPGWYSQLEKVSGHECSSMGKLCSCSWHSAFMVSLRKSQGHCQGQPARTQRSPPGARPRAVTSTVQGVGAPTAHTNPSWQLLLLSVNLGGPAAPGGLGRSAHFFEAQFPSLILGQLPPPSGRHWGHPLALPLAGSHLFICYNYMC